MRNFNQLVSLAWKISPPHLVIYVLLSVTVGLTSVPLPYLSGLAVNTIVSDKGDGHQAVLYMVFGVLSTVAGAAFSGLVSVTSASYEAKIKTKLAGIFADSLAQVRCQTLLEDSRVQNQLMIARQNVLTAPVIILGSLPPILSGLGLSVGLVAALWATWPPMVIVIVLAVCPMIIAQVKVARVHTDLVSQEIESHRSTRYVLDVLTTPESAREVATLQCSQFFREKLTGHIKKGGILRVQAALREFQIDAWSSLASYSGVAAGVGTVTYFCVQGSLPVGALVTFLAACMAIIRALELAAGSISPVVESTTLFGRYLKTVRTLGGESKNELNTSQSCTRSDHVLSVENASFSYPDACAGITCDNFWVEKGEVLAVVGLNGSGKSTFLKIISGAYRPSVGHVKFSKREENEVVSCLYQDAGNYALTLRRNIILGQPSDEVRLHQVIGAVNLGAVVERLPSGLDTQMSLVLGDDDSLEGGYLSGGEWQRVKIARALYHSNGGILILDEPGNHLDVESELSIIDAIFEFCKSSGTALIVVTHQLSLAAKADRVAYMEEGRLVDCLPHRRLQHTSKEYAKCLEEYIRLHAV